MGDADDSSAGKGSHAPGAPAFPAFATTKRTNSSAERDDCKTKSSPSAVAKHVVASLAVLSTIPLQPIASEMRTRTLLVKRVLQFSKTMTNLWFQVMHRSRQLALIVKLIGKRKIFGGLVRAGKARNSAPLGCGFDSRIYHSAGQAKQCKLLKGIAKRIMLMLLHNTFGYSFCDRGSRIRNRIRRKLHNYCVRPD